MRATSENSPTTRRARKRGGFTLLEIIIALALVAILVSAALPYLFDAFANGAGDRASSSLAEKASETRSTAIESGTNQQLLLTPTGIGGSPLPNGWSLQIKGLNDNKFHPPERGRTWEFTRAGVCEPLTIRIVEEGRGGRFIETTFDALTALPIHDEQ